MGDASVGRGTQKQQLTAAASVLRKGEQRWAMLLLHSTVSQTETSMHTVAEDEAD